MKKQFRLLKKYPGSIPVGTIITFSSYDAESFCYGWDDSGQVHIKDVREFPEFWEEVVTPKPESNHTKATCVYYTMVNEEEFLELRKRVEKLEWEVQNLKINPPNTLTFPNPYYEGTYITTTNSNKIEINDEQK